MKKYVIISILLVLVIGGMICINAHNKKVSYSEVEFLENTQLSEAKVLDNVEKNIKTKINGEEINLEYKNTRNNLDTYTNNQGDDYIFKDGELVGFLKKSNLIENKIDEELAKNKAIEFAKDNIENFDRYEFMSSNYTQSYNEHSFRFMRKINGMDTQDTVNINVDGAGQIASFSATHQGEFEKYKKLKVDAEIINNMCLEAVQSKYGEKIKETEIEDQYLKLLNGKLLVHTDISILLKNDESNVLTEIPAWESLICEIN